MACEVNGADAQTIDSPDNSSCREIDSVARKTRISIVKVFHFDNDIVILTIITVKFIAEDWATTVRLRSLPVQNDFLGTTIRTRVSGSC